MIELTVRELREACGGKLICSAEADKMLLNTKINCITTDSRSVLPEEREKNAGTAFLALRGERFDGNSFADAMAKSGVGAIICSLQEKEAAKLAEYGTAAITVNDTQKALGDIALYYNGLFKLPVVAVTGSVGKTSTKEMTAAVLAESFKVLKTEANFNNEIGLPKTLLELDGSYEAAVLEMGMRGPGQIKYLCNIARPSIGVITNIGIAHIELLKSRENIFRAKLEIASYMSEKGKLILNGDDDMLSDRAKVERVLKEYGVSPEIIYFGTSEGCDYRAGMIEAGDEGSRFLFTAPNGSIPVRISLPGKHNIINAVAAAAVGVSCGMSLDAVAHGIETLNGGVFIRQKIEHTAYGITLIDDTYNAGLESMKAAVSVLTDIKISAEGRYCAVLGDMLELGELSEKAHIEVGRFAAERGVALIVTSGRRARDIAEGYKAAGGWEAVCFESSAEAAKELPGLLRSGDIVLVKGSHAMHMELAADAIKKIDKLPQ